MTGRRKKKFESIKTVLLYVALIFMYKVNNSQMAYPVQS